MEIPCKNWYMNSTAKSKTGKYLLVCIKHKTREAIMQAKTTLVYPGAPLEEELTYRDKGALSPIKIMSSITRPTSTAGANVGFYQLSRAIYTLHNLEFLQMAYAGTLGVTFVRDTTLIDWDKVQRVFQELIHTNKSLSKYNNQEAWDRMLQFAQKGNKSIMEEINARNPSNARYNEYVMPSEDVAPSASQASLETMVLGQDVNNQRISYSMYGLFAVLFPYLYTNGQGYYSMVDKSTRSEEDEENGGVAIATMAGVTLKQYVKDRLQMADRRFSRDPAWIFFMLDTINRHDISSANRHVASTARQLTKEQVIDGTNYNDRNTSLVPYTIRYSIGSV